jgi:tetratricopeptide (TPR) repeat protein
MVSSRLDHWHLRWEPFRDAQERALVHIRKAGDRFWVSRVLAFIAHAVTMGPTPIPDAIARMERILDEAGDDHDLRARVRCFMGILMAQQGREAEALAAEAEAEAIYQDLGVEFFLGEFGQHVGLLERILGHPERAEQVLRRSDEIFERAGERGLRSTTVALLAQAFIDQRKVHQAQEMAWLALELGSSDDLATVLTAQTALGTALAERGDARAEETARAAVALAEQTDMLWWQGEALEGLASVLRADGRDVEADAALREALDRFDRKGATSLADRVRNRLRETGNG